MQSAMVVMDMILGAGADSTGDHFEAACNDYSAQSTSLATSAKYLTAKSKHTHTTYKGLHLQTQKVDMSLAEPT